jgi:hypothetical protein
MPFCPNCRYEYEQGVSICPDCNETLVASLPGETVQGLPSGMAAYSSDISDHRDWVQIARLTSYQSADMILEAWHSKNIPAVIVSGAGQFGQTGDGAYSLMVPREHFEDADLEASAILGDEWEKVKLVDRDSW